MVFCFFCGELIKKQNIARHCRVCHNKESRALKEHEEP